MPKVITSAVETKSGASAHQSGLEDGGELKLALSSVDAATYCDLSPANLRVKLHRGEGPERLVEHGQNAFYIDDLNSWLIEQLRKGKLSREMVRRLIQTGMKRQQAIAQGYKDLERELNKMPK